jgi:nucleoside-diphosphate-sugar epimerase
MPEEIRLEGRRAAVTGAGGFIGAAVCRRLMAEGAAVTAIDMRSDALAAAVAAGADPVPADITDRTEIEGALAGADLLVHCAAIVSDAGSMADHISVNVGGTAMVLAAAAAAGVERSVHVSSVVVYGYDNPAELDESAHLRNCGIPYIDTKSASDRLARGRGAVVIRPGDVYGPGSVPWTRRPYELARAGRLAVPGRGDGQMLAVYIDDLTEAILLGLTRGAPGEAYAAWNDSEPVTFAEFFDRVAAMAGTRARRLPAPVLRLAGMAGEIAAHVTGGPPELTRHSVVLISRAGTVSAARARSELGWEPRVSLDEGMRRAEEWLRAEGLAAPSD